MEGPSIRVEGTGAAAVEQALLSAGLSKPGSGAAPDVLVVVGGSAEVTACRSGAPDGAVVLAVADEIDRRTATALLDAGADGVALAGDPPAALADAVRAVASGYVVVASAARHAVRRPVFTTRQKQILGLLVLGLSNREIAQRLFLSEPTVKMHLTAAFAALGVRSRKEAIDVILDPAAGLGTGILGIADPRETQSGYGPPSVS
jgi:DNA-binding NarL/FixJ family response regulator